jgi:hypothetical protein
VENVIPRAEVKDYLNEHFVSYADDCDNMAPEVQQLWGENLPHASTLPFVFLTDAEGEWLGGASGPQAIRPEGFLELLKKPGG